MAFLFYTGQAKRLGARTATLVYRRSEAEMPARIEEVKHAKEEGVIFHVLSNPVELLGDEKGWMTGARCVAMELGESGIRVNSISPGAVAPPIFSVGTDMSQEQAMQSMAIIEAELARIVPVKRAGNSQDIASAAVYLASDESAYVTAQDLAVDGGLIAGYTMEEMFQKFGGLHKALSEKLKS